MAGLNHRASSVLFAALTGALACAPLPPSTEKPSAARGGIIAYRVAVASVTLAPEVELRQAEYRTRYEDAATHVGHYLAEALLERGVEVVPAHDSRGVLADLTRSPDLHRDASRLARAAVERLGVDALLVIEVTRWSPRDPLRSPPSPAAVGFRATLHGGPDGLLLWSGEFSERQVSFFESPWRSLRYPGRGTRWLSVRELARWGSRRLAAQIPIISVEQ
jgi:hypothetical protein